MKALSSASLLLLVPISFFSINTFQLAQRPQKGETIEQEIEAFEKKIFALTIDDQIDSNALYVSLYEWSSSMLVQTSGQLRYKKEYCYLKNNGDSILGVQLRKQDENQVIHDRFIVTKNGTFDQFANHTLSTLFGRYNLGFEKKYLVIRRGFILSPTDSQHTGDSFFCERYVYYERRN